MAGGQDLGLDLGGGGGLGFALDLPEAMEDLQMYVFRERLLIRDPLHGRTHAPHPTPIESGISLSTSRILARYATREG